MQDLLRLQLRGPASTANVPLLVDPGLKISAQMALFLRKLGLTGSAAAFDVHHAEGRSILNPSQTFREAGVRENHVLVLLPKAADAPAPSGPPIEEAEHYGWTPPKPRVRMPESVAALQKAAEEVREGRRSPFEFEPLLAAAFRDAQATDHKLAVARIVQRRKLAAGIPWAAQLLGDPEPRVREQGLLLINRLNAEERAAEIRPLLDDPSGRVRGVAARTLARFAPDDAAAFVVALLADDDPDAREEAAQAVPSLVVKGREAMLLPLLDDDEPSVRRAAVSSLTDLDSRELRRRLPALLADAQDEVRSEACRSAPLLNVEAARAALLENLRHANPDVRIEAVKSLAALKARDAAPALRALLSGDEQELHRAAIDALTELGEARADDVKRFVEERDAGVRRSVVAALHQAKAREELLPFLSDEDPEVQVHACAAVGGPEQQRRLLGFLSHPLWGVRLAAVEALGRTTAEIAATGLTPLLLDTDPFVRAGAAAALARLEYLPAAPAIAAMVADEEPIVRAHAAAALRTLGAAVIRSDLKRLLSHARPTTRRDAIRLLVGFDDRSSIPELAALLADPHPQVRRGSVDGLAQLGAADQASKIRTLLRDPDRRVRFGAAGALASFGDPTSVRPAFDPVCDPAVFSFLPLNGAREPVLWARLRDGKIPSDLRGTPSEIVAAVARLAGVNADLPPEFRSLPDPGAPWSSSVRSRGGVTLLGALWEACEGRHQFILDPGRIRMVADRDAVEEWTGWISRLA